jgi:DNA-directed RNA polymerase subunit RPC12/RpoP
MTDSALPAAISCWSFEQCKGCGKNLAPGTRFLPALRTARRAACARRRNAAPAAQENLASSIFCNHCGERMASTMNGVYLSHQCPQCGAPVQLEETDRIFSCPFCQVRLFIHARRPIRVLSQAPHHPSGHSHLCARTGASGATPSRSARCPLCTRSSIQACWRWTIRSCRHPWACGPRRCTCHSWSRPQTGSSCRRTMPSPDFKARLLRLIPALRSAEGPSLTACVGDTCCL